MFEFPLQWNCDLVMIHWQFVPLLVLYSVFMNVGLISHCFWGSLYGKSIVSPIPRFLMEINSISRPGWNYFRTKSSDSLIKICFQPWHNIGKFGKSRGRGDNWIDLSLLSSGFVVFFLQSTIIVTVFFSTLIATRCHLKKPNNSFVHFKDFVVKPLFTLKCNVF